MEEPAASVLLVRDIRSGNARPSAKPRLWLAMSSADDRRGELWETATYLAIWLCGLVGVGLCFL
jgi:hypothetical protein